VYSVRAGSPDKEISFFQTSSLNCPRASTACSAPNAVSAFLKFSPSLPSISPGEKCHDRVEFGLWQQLGSGHFAVSLSDPLRVINALRIQRDCCLSRQAE